MLPIYKKNILQLIFCCGLILLIPVQLWAQTTATTATTARSAPIAQFINTKDLVLALVSRQNSVSNPIPAQYKSLDAIIINVLEDSPNGVLKPFPSHHVVRYQQAFRLKMIASRNGEVEIFQLTQDGKLNPKAIFTETIKYGQETISQRIFINPNTQTKALIVSFKPKELLGSSSDGWTQKLLNTDAKQLSEYLRMQHSSASTYIVNTSAKEAGVLAIVSVQK